MPIVLITLTLGIFIGYWLCRMQLRGKFLLLDEKMPLPDPWCHPSEAPLSQQWNLPTHNAPPLTEHHGLIPIEPSRRVLKHFPNAPLEHFSAKQVIGGQDSHGFSRTPQYPNGLEGWYQDHGFRTVVDE